VLLVIPPSLGYGRSGSPPVIRGADTLVYVVDVIAAIHG
jgi:peptidylprolyl isomerase